MFMFRLALQLGCTVEELGNRITAHEFLQWRSFSLYEPFGSQAEDFRASLYPLLKINSSKSNGEKLAHPADLFPWGRSYENAVKAAQDKRDETARQRQLADEAERAVKISRSEKRARLMAMLLGKGG